MGVLGRRFSSLGAAFLTNLKGRNIRNDLLRDGQNFKEEGCQKVGHRALLPTMNYYSFS